MVKLWKRVRCSKLQNFEFGVLWWFGHVTNSSRMAFTSYASYANLKKIGLHEIVFSAVLRSLPPNE
jgi:hypothetical protein